MQDSAESVPASLSERYEEPELEDLFETTCEGPPAVTYDELGSGWKAIGEAEPEVDVAEPLPDGKLLTDPECLAALSRITGDSSAVDTLVRNFRTWEELSSASPYIRAGRVGPWAAALRLTPFCPPMAPPGPGVKILSRYRAGTYPTTLSRLESPPPLIYLRGQIPKGLMVAIGGMHRPTPNGISRSRLAARVAQMLVLVVTASLDTGCGRAALEESIRANQPALAVAGSSIESVGPNDGLIEELISIGGGVISPFPAGTAWSEMGCIQGSELVAAMGHVVVIAEFGLHLAGGMSMVQAAMHGGRPLITFTHGQDGVPLWGSSLLTRETRRVDTYGKLALPPELIKNRKAAARALAGLPLVDAVVKDAASLERAVAVLAG